MRGFLGFAFLLVVALVLAALVVVPAVARPIVVDAVREVSPFGDQPIDVEVDVSPVALLLGTVDRIRVTGTGLETEGVLIGSLDLSIHDVSTSNRTFRALDGRLSAVALPFVTSSVLVIDSISLSGTSGDVDAVARLDLRASLSLVGNAFADAGVPVDGLELVAGGVAFNVLGQRVTVPLGVDAGALVIPDVAGGGPLVVVEPGPDDPWRITGVEVTPSGLEIHAALEPDGVVEGARR